MSNISNPDADTVDGHEGHAPTKSAHDAMGIDADTVDGSHASDLGSALDWVDDGAFSSSGASSHTYNLSTSYDHFMLIGSVFNDASSDQQVRMRLNGDTGANYDEYNVGGARDTGISYIRLAEFPGANSEAFIGAIYISGKWNTDAVARNKGADVATNDAVFETGNNDTITSPLSSVTIYGGGGGNIAVDMNAVGYNE